MARNATLLRARGWVCDTRNQPIWNDLIRWRDHLSCMIDGMSWLSGAGEYVVRLIKLLFAIYILKHEEMANAGWATFIVFIVGFRERALSLYRHRGPRNNRRRLEKWEGELLRWRERKYSINSVGRRWRSREHRLDIFLRGNIEVWNT